MARLSLQLQKQWASVEMGDMRLEDAVGMKPLADEVNRYETCWMHKRQELSMLRK